MKIDRVGLFLALVASVAPTFAAEPPDPRVAWLEEYGVEIATLDPAAADLSDLAPLKQALDGVRVVMLGEATRGDGSTFLAKTRLIRFLHQEMGFDVLALECGFHACDRAWRESATGEDLRRALADAVLPLYGRSEPFQPLLDLVAGRRGGDRPLVVAGIDPELSGDPGPLLGGLRDLLGRLGRKPGEVPGFVEAAEIVANLARGAYASGEAPVPAENVRRRFAGTLAALGEILETAPPGDAADAAFWRQVLENLDVQARMAWELGAYRPGHGVPAQVTTLANRQAADNLLWLTRRHPGKKVIVSALTVLLARRPGRLETGDLDTKARLERFVTVGDVIDGALGDQAYLLAFTAGGGHSGTPFREPYALLEPTAGSFEELMRRTGLEAAFVDLRGLKKAGRQGRWLRGPVIARPLSYKELRGSWPRHVDGFFFLRTLEPSRAVRSAAPP